MQSKTTVLRRLAQTRTTIMMPRSIGKVRMEPSTGKTLSQVAATTVNWVAPIGISTDECQRPSKTLRIFQEAKPCKDFFLLGRFYE